MVRSFATLAAVALLHVQIAASLRTSREGAPEAETTARLRPAVLHFMFELKDSFPHPGIWGKFFDSAQPGSYMAWAHCTDYHACKNDYVLDLLKVRLVPTTFSVRGADLMSPFVHMMRYALPLTEHLAAAGVMEKFMVISDSTLPVKPFSYVFRHQVAEPVSDICMSSINQWASGNVDGVPVAIIKHHQWVSLNRSDAEVLARDWRPVRKSKYWNVPLRQGSWASQNRTVPRYSFHGGTWYTATDEEAVWALIHGPLMLPSAGDQSEPMRVYGQRRCTTYVGFPADIGESPNRTGKASLQASMLQLVAESSEGWIDRHDITRQLRHDPATKLYVADGTWHPFLIEEAGDRSIRTLRESEFLFARKFSACARMVNFTEVAFAE